MHRVLFGVLIAAIFGLSISYLFLGLLPVQSILLSISVTTIIITACVFGVLLLMMRPIHLIMRAITMRSGEPTVQTPPNPNVSSLISGNLKPVLDTIYGSSPMTPAVGFSATQAVTTATPALSLLEHALEQTSCGIIALNAERKVIAHNVHAPIKEGADKQPEIELEFINMESLDEWLDSLSNTAVHAEKTWQRVSNKLAGEEGRRMFDIIATYERGSQTETVIACYERTLQYMPEEDDLDFIAFAAHELRGPITVIRGYLDVLGMELEDSLDDDQRELLKRLVVSSNRLSGYINNILNASRFDRRHLKVHLKEETIEKIYDTISDDMTMRATAQNRILSVKFDHNLPTIAADKGSIGEVLGNLIDNAIKYSNEGGIISVYAEIEGDFLKVSVADRGIGMPSNVIENLFKKFYRSHRSRETVAGTGIGLYICKAFIESHGGFISVRSQEGVGSIFSFTLPIYSTVKQQLLEGDNLTLIRQQHGWIKNHSSFRG